MRSYTSVVSTTMHDASTLPSDAPAAIRGNAAVQEAYLGTVAA